MANVELLGATSVAYSEATLVPGTSLTITEGPPGTFTLDLSGGALTISGGADGGGIGKALFQGPNILAQIFQAPIAAGGQSLGDNVFVGGAGNNTLTNGAGAVQLASNNIGIGVRALQSLTDAAINIAIGTEAMQATDTGQGNVAIGYQALKPNTSGFGNVAIGTSAMQANTTGGNNTAVGVDALFTNISGGRNSAFGADALGFNTTGGDNSAVGFNALFSNTTGSENVAVGFHSLFSNLIGSFSTAIGYQAAEANLVDNTVAIGFQALQANTTGTSNTAVGTLCLFTNTTGSENTAIGLLALSSNVAGNRNVALGFYAGRYYTGSDRFYVNNRNQVNTAGDDSNSLIVGTFDASPLNQRLVTNANFQATGKYGSKRVTINLVNGANQDITGVTSSLISINGPTGAFSIGGIAGGSDGQEVTFVNNIAFAVTLNYNDAGSAAGNKIFHYTAANVTPAGTTWAWFTVKWMSIVNGWMLMQHS